MIGLLQLATADFDYIGQVSENLRQQLGSDVALTGEQAIERILIVTTMLRKRVEFLRSSIQIFEGRGRTRNSPPEVAAPIRGNAQADFSSMQVAKLDL